MSVGQAKKAVRFLMVSCKLEKVRASGRYKGLQDPSLCDHNVWEFTKGILCGRIDQRAISLAGIVLGGCGIVTVTKMPQELHMMSDLMLRSSEGKKANVDRMSEMCVNYAGLEASRQERTLHHRSHVHDM